MTDPYFAASSDLDVVRFRDICSQQTSPASVPLASTVRDGVPHYDAQTFVHAAANPAAARALKTELHGCLRDGPGVLAVRGAWADAALIDRATTVFRQLIQNEQATAGQRGDHFARPGENERLWNALQKFCEEDTRAFLEYYANPVPGLMAEAWLGPHYQITSQINIVKPGGACQQPHRDYHLGFQDDAVVRQFPVSVQQASQFLTLQGAVAHTDMTQAAGPTQLLPWSQQYSLGYLAWRDPAFREVFAECSVQLPLDRGDAIFFSPALMHAAGSNSEQTDRIANLLQISAAFGKTMETVDWMRISSLAYPVLLDRVESGLLAQRDLRWLGGAVADGYAFPTNLDTDPPVNGSAPESAQQLMLRSLATRTPVSDFTAALQSMAQRRHTAG